MRAPSLANGPPRRDGSGANARHINRWHWKVDRLQHGVCEAVVVIEAAAQPGTPARHPTAGVQLEGRLTPIERRRDMVPHKLQKCCTLSRRVSATTKRFLETHRQFRHGK